MPIPKVIHYCWFGGGQKNELITRCIESWRKYAKNCEIIEWNESNYDVSKNQYMYDAYKSKRWGFVSDYARLDIVYNYGGIYLDTDVELIKPIDELLDGTGFIGFEQQSNDGKYYINTGGGFGAQKHDPVIGRMLKYYDSLLFIKSDGSLNMQPCPLYNTNAILELGLICNNMQQKVDSITVYPYDYFCPVNWKTHKCATSENTFSIHHFDASWLSEQEKKKRKWDRRLDRLVHLPNEVLLKLLGAERYGRIKKRIKGR